MSPLLRTMALGVLLVVCTAVPVTAQNRALVIYSVTPDRVSNSMTIRGVNFGSTPEHVFLETSMMPVLSWSPTEIVASLPAEVPDGSYLVTVAKGHRASDQDVFHFSLVTIPALLCLRD
jgi:hypothetical protein